MTEHPRRQGVVAVITRGERFLVIRRSAHVAAPGKFCFPGGGIEQGELEEVALRRELHEELNVHVQPLRCLWRSTTPWRVALAWWHAELSWAETPAPNPAEVESVHWLRAGEICELPELLESNHQFFQAWHRGVFALPDLQPPHER